MCGSWPQKRQEKRTVFTESDFQLAGRNLAPGQTLEIMGATVRLKRTAAPMIRRK